MEIRATDDAGPRIAGPGEADSVPVRRNRPVRHGAATRRRRLSHHVDEVLDSEPDTGTRRLVAGDEGGHCVVDVVMVAPGGNWNSDGEGDDVKSVISKLVESDATLT